MDRHNPHGQSQDKDRHDKKRHDENKHYQDHESEGSKNNKIPPEHNTPNKPPKNSGYDEKQPSSK